ncbi:hypothetical protein [Actinoallomurus sp. NPDC052274]|uniref:hypothetical protein n=1 Tax=Actinoallomurus sp. NPDC052274 TaxID=3155420 RepID=UPI00343ABC7E
MSKLTYCSKKRPAEAAIRLRPLALAAVMTFSGLAVAVAAAAPAEAARGAQVNNRGLTAAATYCEGMPREYASDCTESVDRFLPPDSQSADDDKAGPDDVNVDNHPHVIRDRDVRESRDESRSPRRRHGRRAGAGEAHQGRQAGHRPRGTEGAQSAQGSRRGEGDQLAQEPRRGEGARQGEGEQLAQEPRRGEGARQGESDQLGQNPYRGEAAQRGEGDQLAQSPHRGEGTRNVRNKPQKSQRPVIRMSITRR